MLTKLLAGVAFALIAPLSPAQDVARIDIWSDANGHSTFLGNLTASCTSNPTEGTPECRMPDNPTAANPQQGEASKDLLQVLGAEPYLWAQKSGNVMAYWVRLKDCQVVAFGEAIDATGQTGRVNHCGQSTGGEIRFTVSVSPSQSSSLR